MEKIDEEIDRSSYIDRYIGRYTEKDGKVRDTGQRLRRER